ncbi:hypothetical protein GCM10027563_23750 [Parasphingorhabdus pacifica]
MAIRRAQPRHRTDLHRAAHSATQEAAGYAPNVTIDQSKDVDEDRRRAKPGKGRCDSCHTP